MPRYNYGIAAFVEQHTHCRVGKNVAHRSERLPPLDPLFEVFATAVFNLRKSLAQFVYATKRTIFDWKIGA